MLYSGDILLDMKKNNELASSLFFPCPIDCPSTRGRVFTPGSVTNGMVPWPPVCSSANPHFVLPHSTAAQGDGSLVHPLNVPKNSH